MKTIKKMKKNSDRIKSKEQRQLDKTVKRYMKKTSPESKSVFKMSKQP